MSTFYLRYVQWSSFAMHLANAFAILKTKMSDAVNPGTGGVVASDSSPAAARARRRLAFIGAAIAVIVLIGIVAFMFLRTKVNTGANILGLFQFETNTTQGSKPSPAEQVKSAQTAVQAAKTTAQQNVAYVSLGSAYLSASQPAQAIQAYKSALTAAPAEPTNTSALSGLVSAYAQAGQLDNEAAALKQLIPLLEQSSDPVDKTAAGRLKVILNELEHPDNRPWAN